MNIEQARFNMIEQQIRTWDVLDPDVLELLAEVKRERFVAGRASRARVRRPRDPAGRRPGDVAAEGRGARRCRSWQSSRTRRVYEVGHRQRLSHGAPRARARARDERGDPPRPSSSARARASRPRASRNVTLLAGDSARAPLGEATYDVIVLTGSTPVLPQAFLDRLNPGGRLFAVVGDAPGHEGGAGAPGRRAASFAAHRALRDGAATPGQRAAARAIPVLMQTNPHPDRAGRVESHA